MLLPSLHRAQELLRARAVPLLALLLVAMAVALTQPAQSRDQTQLGPRTPCIDECMSSGCAKAKTSCYEHCKTICFLKGAHPATGIIEAAPAAEAQVCCRITRGFRSIYSWQAPDACKPPKRTVMENTAKCPLQRSQ